MGKLIQNFDEFFAPDGNITQEIEDLLKAKDIMRLIDKCDTWGILASFSPYVTDWDNKVSWVRLKKDVTNMKLDYEQFTSSYRYPEESKVTRIKQELLFVPDIKIAPLLLLGARYNQATVIHGNRIGASAYNVETCKPEMTVTKSDMLTAWTSLITLPGNFIMHDNPNDVSIHRSNETIKKLHANKADTQTLKFIEPVTSAKDDIKKIWDCIDSGEFFGVISAYQPGCSVLTLAEEHKMLQKDVIKLKCDYIEQNYEYNFADGNGMTLVWKKSLFVPQLPYAELIELGKKWNQETVTFGGNGGITMVRVSDQKVLMDMEVDSMKLAWNFLLTNQRNIPW